MAISFLEQYANVFIPLGISFASLVGSLYVYKEKISNLEKNIEKLTLKLKEMRDKVIACETSLKERQREVYVQRRSPLSLTDSGKTLLSSSGGSTFVDDNFAFLYQRVEDRKPKTAYDVQQLAQEVLNELQSDDKFNGLKEYAFKTGLLLDVIIEVMGIYLRDKILLQKNLNVEDIDKHDPTRKPGLQT